MSEEAHRTIFGTFGGALFISGIVVGANWLATVAGASPDLHLSVNNPIFYLAVSCVVIGTFVVAGAVTETKYLPLPGKRNIALRRQSEERRLILERADQELEEADQELNDRLNNRALLVLGRAHYMGQKRKLVVRCCFPESWLIS
jgi:hypothetical protein